MATSIVVSQAVSGRTTSTSFITGAGLKKWMPHTRSGREVARAKSITGNVEVLVARIAEGLRGLVEFGEQRQLHADLFDHRLDHEVAVAEWSESLGRGDPAHDTAAFVVGRLPRSTAFDKPLSIARSTPSADACEREDTMTSYPARAATSARPAPMIPEPTMPTVRISAALDMAEPLATRG